MQSQSAGGHTARLCRWFGRVGPGAFGSQPQCFTGLAPRLGAVSTAIDREHPAARDSLAAKPGHGSDQNASSCCLLLIGQNLGIGKPCRIVDCDVGLFVAHTARTPQAPISHDPVADAFKPSQLFDVDMNRVAGLVPLVSAYRHRLLLLFERSQAHGLEGSPHGGERCR